MVNLDTEGWLHAGHWHPRPLSHETRAEDSLRVRRPVVISAERAREDRGPFLFTAAAAVASVRLLTALNAGLCQEKQARQQQLPDPRLGAVLAPAPLGDATGNAAISDSGKRICRSFADSSSIARSDKKFWSVRAVSVYTITVVG